MESSLKPLLDVVLFLVWVTVYLAAVSYVSHYRKARAHAIGPAGRTDYRSDKDVGLRLAVLALGTLTLLLAYAAIRFLNYYF